MHIASKVSKSALAIVLLVAMISLPGFARDKNETIDATAYGTSTQLGRNVGVTLIIYEFSTPETGRFWLRRSRRARTKDWSTRCRR